MEQTLSILLIEDDANDCKNITNCVKQSEYLKLITTTGNARHALEMVQVHQPNIILLDLELHQGGGNGLIFLEGLHQLELNLTPFILITTQNNSSATLSRARELGADFILAKYEDGYSAQYVIDYLEVMYPAIIRKNSMHLSSDALTPEEQQQAIIKRIKLELELLGITANITGYKYLTDAIAIIMEERVSNLPSILAAKYGKTTASVERAMQNAIKSAWVKSNIDDLLKYYTARIDPERGYPTTTEFVYYYADKLQDEFELG